MVFPTHRWEMKRCKILWVCSCALVFLYFLPVCFWCNEIHPWWEGWCVDFKVNINPTEEAFFHKQKIRYSFYNWHYSKFHFQPANPKYPWAKYHTPTCLFTGKDLKCVSWPKASWNLFISQTITFTDVLPASSSDGFCLYTMTAKCLCLLY